MLSFEMIKSLLIFGLSLIGIYALVCWLIDNLNSIVQIIRSVLKPYFQPDEKLSLVERYGNWAGKCNSNFLLLVFRCSFIL